MAGMSGVPYRWFAFYDGIGALLWATLGIWTGSVLAREFTLIVDRFKDAQLILVYLAATGLLLFVLMKWLVRHLHGRAEIVQETGVDAKISNREPVQTESLWLNQPGSNRRK